LGFTFAFTGLPFPDVCARLPDTRSCPHTLVYVGCCPFWRLYVRVLHVLGFRLVYWFGLRFDIYAVCSVWFRWLVLGYRLVRSTLRDHTLFVVLWFHTLVLQLVRFVVPLPWFLVLVRCSVPLWLYLAFTLVRLVRSGSTVLCLVIVVLRCSFDLVWLVSRWFFRWFVVRSAVAYVVAIVVGWFGLVGLVLVCSFGLLFGLGSLVVWFLVLWFWFWLVLLVGSTVPLWFQFTLRFGSTFGSVCWLVWFGWFVTFVFGSVGWFLVGLVLWFILRFVWFCPTFVLVWFFTPV